MQGQSNHFTRYAPEKIQYGINRYQNETKRLYGVLDKHLSSAGTPYLVGDKATIADFAHWGWITAAGWAGIELSDFPKLKEWEERMWERPGVQKGASVPDPYKRVKNDDPEAMERRAAEARKWIMQGMKEDEEKNRERAKA
jgi:glutathione S-transferase